MSKGLNKVMIIGNLGNDPEMRYTPDGTAIANLSIATSESWKDKNTGQQQEKTEWHRIVAFRRLAEIMGEYLNKGSKVYIEGKLQTRKWTDQQGQDRYTTEIIADQMQMLTARDGGNAGSVRNGEQRTARDGGNAGSAGSSEQYDSRDSGNHQNGYQQRSQPTNNSNQYHQNNASQPNRQSPVPSMDFDDDIPF